ncbi:MAG: hypothetical protein AAGC81_10565 [Pseudomonadota bacterium]
MGRKEYHFSLFDAAVVAVALSFFAIATFVYQPFLSDDALISLRYAERFASGSGLTWNDGYYVEGYSNLAWVLGLSALIKVGIEPVIALRLFSFTVSLVALLLFLGVALKRNRGITLGYALILSTASIHVVPVWTLGGLEQPLLLLGLLVSGFLIIRWWETGQEKNHLILFSSAALGVVVLTRPDSPLFVAAYALIPLLAQADIASKVRSTFLLVGIPIACFGFQLAFRMHYYGDVVPNTAHVKMSGSVNHALDGLNYTITGLALVLPAIFAALFGYQLSSLRRRRLIGAFLSGIVIWCCYISFIGGDIFPGFRHLTPVIALSMVALIAGLGSSNLLELSRTQLSPKAPVSFLIVLVFCTSYFSAQFLAPDYRATKHEAWVWQCRDLAADLKDRFGAEHPLLAVTAAGCLPFWTEFETVDLLGLNDLELPKRKPREFGSGMIGHELRNVDYLLEREPDIVVIHIGTGTPDFLSGFLDGDERFNAAYCEMIIELDDKTTRLVFLSRGFAARTGNKTNCRFVAMGS